MTLEMKLPALPGGAARVLRWLAAEGAAVEAGTPVVVVLTGLAEVLLPAPAAGALASLAPVGTMVDPGATLARLAPAESRSAQDAPQAGASPTPRAPALPATAHTAAEAPRLRATPLARKIALAHGVELGTLAGTGPAGCVRAADVRAALAPQPAAAPQPVPNFQPAPSTAHTRSNPLAPLVPSSPGPPLSASAPTATATFELDACAALARAAALSGQLARLGLRAGLLACVLEAAAAALPAHPYLNARWGDDTIVLRRRLHIAAAEPSGEGGLRWALVADAGDLTLRGVARALSRSDTPDLESATFAVVGLEDGASWHSAVAPLPRTAAALFVGAPGRRTVAVDGAVAVREVALLTLSYDARVLDHSHAAAFLSAVRGRLEQAR